MQCHFIKPDNAQCQANAMVGFNYCFSHNPETATNKKTAVIKGGKSPKPRKASKLRKPLPIKGISDVLELLEGTINELRTEEALTHQRANSIGYLSSVMLKAMETGQLEERIVILENQVLNKN